MRSSLAGVDQPGRPIQGISGREAAEILGLSSEISVCRLVGTGVLTKAKHLGAPSTATRSSGSRCSGTDPVIRTGPRRARPRPSSASAPTGYTSWCTAASSRRLTTRVGATSAGSRSRSLPTHGRLARSPVGSAEPVLPPIDQQRAADQLRRSLAPRSQCAPPPDPPALGAEPLPLRDLGHRAVTRFDLLDVLLGPTWFTATTVNRYFPRARVAALLRTDAATVNVRRATTRPVELILFAVTR